MAMQYMRPAIKFSGSRKGATGMNTGIAPIASTVQRAPMVQRTSRTRATTGSNSGMQRMPMEQRYAPMRRT